MPDPVVVTVPRLTGDPSLYVMVYDVDALKPPRVIEPSDKPQPDGLVVDIMLNVGLALTVIVTDDDDDVHGLLEMVQVYTYVPAVVKPVMVVVGEVAVVMVDAGPLVCVHKPVPTVGVLAAMVTVPTLVQTVCAGPALLVVGLGLTVIVTFEVEGVQGELVIDH